MTWPFITICRTGASMRKHRMRGELLLSASFVFYLAVIVNERSELLFHCLCEIN